MATAPADGEGKQVLRMQNILCVPALVCVYDLWYDIPNENIQKY